MTLRSNSSVTALSIIPLAIITFWSRNAASQQLPKPMVRDSGGVRIVEYGTIKTAAPAFRIGPLLASVGGLRDDPREEIDSRTGIESAVRLSNGNIAVAEWATVRVLDASGRLVRIIGGKGGGPGQVSGQISRVCALPTDSILVISNDRRVSTFDPSGRHVVTSAFTQNVLGTCAFGAGLLGYSMVKANPADRRLGSPATQRVKLFHLTRDGKGGNEIGTFNAWIRPSIVSDEFSTSLHRSVLYADNGIRGEIKKYSINGKLTGIIRWHDPLISITQDLLRERPSLRTPATASTELRRFLPAYRSFFVDKAGRLWVQDYWLSARNGRYAPGYTVFGSDDQLLGRYEVPEGSYSRAIVTDAGTNYVVVRMSHPEEGIAVVVQSISAVSR